jgi:hypothetical protein
MIHFPGFSFTAIDHDDDPSVLFFCFVSSRLLLFSNASGSFSHSLGSSVMLILLLRARFSTVVIVVFLRCAANVQHVVAADEHLADLAGAAATNELFCVLQLRCEEASTVGREDA